MGHLATFADSGSVMQLIATRGPAFAGAILLAGMVGEAFPAGGRDRAAVTGLFPTASGGREWSADWEVPRTIAPYEFDPRDPLCRNSSDVPLHIADGIASFLAGTTRLYVLTPTNAAGRFTTRPWRNVEMTVYARRGASTRAVDWQAFYLSARSGWVHDDKFPCEGTSYHATARFDGQFGFKKELWHTGGYTQFAPGRPPKPWPTVPVGKWTGLKFVCRNFDHDRKVKLQFYLDAEERNVWKLVAEFDDTGGWRGEKPGCDRAQDMILTAGYPAVYFRADYVAVELKKFSVREIAPLP
jgi:hypothetical protein